MLTQQPTKAGAYRGDNKQPVSLSASLICFVAQLTYPENRPEYRQHQDWQLVNEKERQILSGKTCFSIR